MRAPIVTTEYIVAEVGNTLTHGPDRAVFTDFYRALQDHVKLEVIPASTELMNRGAELFADRADKDWSLTDCISFVVMADRRISDALTTDSDFEQAGFRALLRSDPGSA